MSSPDYNYRHHEVISLINKRTGDIRTVRPNGVGLQAALSFPTIDDQTAIRRLGDLTSSIQCIRNRQTGEVTSMVTRVHRYDGGFAVTKRQRIVPGEETDGRQYFAQSNLAHRGEAVVHTFKPLDHGNNTMAPRTCGRNDRAAPAAVTHNDNHAPPGNENEDDMIQSSPIVAHAHERLTRTRIPRPKQKEVKLSEQNLLRRAIALHRQRLRFLSDPSSQNPHIRIHHLYRNRRTLAFASTVLKSERGLKPIISVLWETKTSPHRAVSVSFSRPPDSDELVAHCSCDPLVPQRKGHHEICYHASEIFANQDFMDFMKSEIRRRQEGRNVNESNSSFGECIDLIRLGERSPYLTAVLYKDEKARNKSVKPWTFFMVLDTTMQIFIPVFKMFGKTFQCMVCRTNAARRGSCSHEDACTVATGHMRQIRGMASFFSDLGIHDDDFPSDDGSDDDTEVEDEAESSEDEEDNVGNRSVRVPEIYHPTDFTRPLLPCDGEQWNMSRLANALNNLPQGRTLAFDDRNKASCPKCNTQNTKPRYIGYRRRVKLYTLLQGTHWIAVYDWYCDTCQERRYFTGKGTGVFPTRKKSCYTTELMYLLLEMSCMHGISIRTAHKIFRLFSKTPTVALHLNSINGHIPGKDGEPCRRRTNDAFRIFLDHVDTSSPMVTKKLFSCETCEVPLTEEDRKELGMTGEHAPGLRRLKAVVMDGTAAGILTKLPKFDRPTSLVPPATGGLGATTLLHQAKHRKVVRKFLHLSRKCLRKWKTQRIVSPVRSPLGTDLLRFWLYNPSKLNIEGTLAPSESMTELQAQISALHISPQTCFCRQPAGEARPVEQHDDKCSELHTSFTRSEQCNEISNMLKQLFGISVHGPAMVTNNPPPGYMNNGDHADDMDLEYDMDAHESSDESDIEETIQTSSRRHDGAISATLLLPDARKNAQFAESAISLMQFLLLDHISMPYVGRISEEYKIVQDNGIDQLPQTGEPESPNRDAQSPPSSMTAFTYTSFKLHQNLVEALTAYASCMHFQEDGIAQNVPRECDCVNNFKHATMEINEASPVLGMFCQEFLKLRRPLHITYSTVATSLIDLLKRHMEAAKNFFITLENNVSEESKSYYDMHGSVQDSTLEGRYRMLQTTSQDNSENQSSGGSQEVDAGEQDSQGRLAQIEGQRMQVQGERASTQEDAADATEQGTESRQETQTHQVLQRTEIQQETGSSPQVQEFEANGEGASSHVTTEEDMEEVIKRLDKLGVQELKESKLSGICFPGRLSCRPCIVFKCKDHHSCSKKYTKSRSHTPGLLTLQCSCSSPKLIGFIVMTQAESTALALSAMLSHLGIPPRCIYYDNACNLFLSTLLRVPWILGKTRLVVDRFHYKSHKCSAYFDPDSYRQFDMQSTEAAESINARIEKSLNTIRYMNGEKLIPYLRSRFAFVNLIATFKQKYKRTDVEDENMTDFFNSITNCQCGSCKEYDDYLDTLEEASEEEDKAHVQEEE